MCSGRFFVSRRHSDRDAAQIGAYVEFDVTEGEEVLVKAASSFTDRDGALKNLKAEIPHWDFGQTCTELRQMWEKHLSAIDVETERLADKEMFYGAFYRASFLPHTFNDIDGRYPSLRMALRYANFLKEKRIMRIIVCGIPTVPCIR